MNPTTDRPEVAEFSIDLPDLGVQLCCRVPIDRSDPEDTVKQAILLMAAKLAPLLAPVHAVAELPGGGQEHIYMIHPNQGYGPPIEHRYLFVSGEVPESLVELARYALAAKALAEMEPTVKIRHPGSPGAEPPPYPPPRIVEHADIEPGALGAFFEIGAGS